MSKTDWPDKFWIKFTPDPDFDIPEPLPVKEFNLERGIPISERDLQIASIAMANNLIVVAHNTKEFIRVAGLTVEDWAL